MFKERNGEIYYLSDKGIEYSLLLGKTNNDLSSDIIFVLREPTEQEIEEQDFCGEVIGFTYGGFRHLEKEFIEDMIKKYEKTHLTK